MDAELKDVYRTLQNHQIICPTRRSILNMPRVLSSVVLLVISFQSINQISQATTQTSPLDQALQQTLERLNDKKLDKKMYSFHTDPTVLNENLLYDDVNGMLNSNLPKRSKRATQQSNSNTQFKETQPQSQPQTPQQQLVDACQSKLEVLTPYYATNSKGKVRVVVNSELMQQAIQVETCVRGSQIVGHPSGARCNANPDCGCEQKYKWHRLLVLDTNETEAKKGLFTDWFLFPSNCVCRCKSRQQQFLRMLKRS